MREKYESLSVVVLKDLARARGLKGVSAMKKNDLVELMLKEDERVEQEKRQQTTQESDGAGDAGTLGTADRAEIQTAQRNAENDREQMETRENTEISRERLETRANVENYRERVQSGRANAEARFSADIYRERAETVRNSAETQRERAELSRGSADAQRDRTEVRNSDPYRGRAEQRERPEMRGAETVRERTEQQPAERYARSDEESLEHLDSGMTANGILEVMPDGYGFIRCANYLPGENDVYVSPTQIRKFCLKTGDIIVGNTRVRTQQEKFAALLYVTAVNGYQPNVIQRRKNFEDLTPIFPNERIRLERSGCSVAMRIVDLVSPIGKGQRGMIVSQPKAGKTTLLKEIAKSVTTGNPDMHLIILLIDERPEEVTDIKEAIEGKNVEVIYSTFDELPEHHKRVSEMVIERAKRLVEHGRDVMILLDSITRLARAYNLIVPPSGRTLSGGLDPAALHMPKRFFGAARKMREGGSLTILATALVDTGSKMDDVVFEEFKGTGNMELVLDRKLSEKRVFPAIDIVKSGTRREDLLLNAEEREAVDIMRKAINGMRTDDAVENILNMFARTRTNREYIGMVKKNRIL